MAITTVTSSVSANYTVEISSGTAQEVADRIAALLIGRKQGINFFVEGFSVIYNQSAIVYVLLKYMTTPD